MTIPTLTAAPPAPNKYGGDPVAFDFAMQAWLTWEATRSAEDPAFLAWIDANTTVITANANASQSDRVLVQAGAAAVAAQSPVANAAAAAASALAAQAYASAAQATNPDSPIHTNPRSITADFTLGSGYNGWSAGPISISESATLTIADNAALSII